MAGQLDTYREEIFNFLRTVTIKFEPFAYLMGETYMNTYGINDPHGTWNPYYINICGEYSENDTLMTVYSLEEERHVPFNKDLAKNYPATAALYKIPNTEYFTLEERYPENTGLIRSIAYPAPDINAAIEAPNFTLLAYDDSLLHINERESLVKCLKNFLEMVRVRWWIEEFTYENMFAVTFWAMLWQHLPTLLLTQRIRNIKTPYVHPFHIWEYLKSKGLGDYRDVLTNNQSLWLYRNINYIQKNKGKMSNLKILAENLLDELYISLLYKDMVQSPDKKWESDCITTPEFKSYNLVTGEEVKIESMNTLNDRLFDIDYEQTHNADFVDAKEVELGSHKFNELPTKYLEFKKEPVNTRNERLMVNYFLDTLMYRYSLNHLSYNVKLTNPLTNVVYPISVADTILLWHYACWRSLDISEGIAIPSIYTVYTPFLIDVPKQEDLTRSVYHNSTEFRIQNYVDITKHLNSITWFKSLFTSSEKFVDYLVANFKYYVGLRGIVENSHSYIFHLAMRRFLMDVTVQKTLEVQLTTHTSYDDYFEAKEGIKPIVDMFEAEEGNRWMKLVEACFDALFPLQAYATDNFFGNIRTKEIIYTSIRDLFIHLGSYNVTYLESDRDTRQYLQVEEPDFFILKRVNAEYTRFFNVVLEKYIFRHKYMHNIALPNLKEEIVCTIQSFSNNVGFKIPVEYDTSRKDTWHKDGHLKGYQYSHKQTGLSSSTNKKIFTENVSINKQ